VHTVARPCTRRSMCTAAARCARAATDVCTSDARCAPARPGRDVCGPDEHPGADAPASSCTSAAPRAHPAACARRRPGAHGRRRTCARSRRDVHERSPAPARPAQGRVRTGAPPGPRERSCTVARPCTPPPARAHAAACARQRSGVHGRRRTCARSRRDVHERRPAPARLRLGPVQARTGSGSDRFRPGRRAAAHRSGPRRRARPPGPGTRRRPVRR